jgi:hypothetical protein
MIKIPISTAETPLIGEKFVKPPNAVNNTKNKRPKIIVNGIV